MVFNGHTFFFITCLDLLSEKPEVVSFHIATIFLGFAV